MKPRILTGWPISEFAGLDDALRTISRKDLRDRQTAYLRSELSLIKFGNSILAIRKIFAATIRSIAGGAARG